jgi:hypothetical protein
MRWQKPATCRCSHCAHACIIYCIQQNLISPLVISIWHLTPILSNDFTTPFPSVYLTCVPPPFFIQRLFYNSLVLSTPWSVAGCIIRQIANCTSEHDCTTSIISGLVSFGCQMTFVRITFVKLFHVHVVVFECLAFIFCIFCSHSY